MNKKILSFLLCVAFCSVLNELRAQNPKPSKKGQKQYITAKSLLNTEKYQEANLIFDAIYKNPKNYELRANSLFYIAVGHQKSKNLAEARQTIEKLLTEFPAFQGREEALYMLAELQFISNEAEKALQTIEKIQEDNTAPDAQNMKGYFLRQMELNALRDLLPKRPKDKMLAQIIADKIATQSTEEQDIDYMEQLIADLKLEKPATMRYERKILTKPAYKIAVLLPFELERMKQRDTTTLNRISVSLYQGMRAAQRQLDTLGGVKVRLYAYEIGSKDKGKLAKLLKDKEFQDIDAFVGPVFDSLNRAVAEILPTQKALLVNPISLDAKMIVNPYTYLYESTPETQAQRVVDFLSTQGENKNMVIFYDDLRKNKNLATFVKQKAEKQGFKVIVFEEVSVSDLSIIRTTFDKYNRFDVGSMVVSSSSTAVAEEVAKFLQVNSFAVPVIVPDSWLRIQNLDYELYEKLKIHVLAPEYLDIDDAKTLPLKKAYSVLARQDMPNNNPYPYVGYEVVHHLAKLWETAGTQANYDKVLPKMSPYQGKTGEWLWYEKGKQDNQFVPILHFVKKEMGVDVEIANKPK
jgi:ABC-type branched-subunit amino acid transport system substrate-binding protein